MLGAILAVIGIILILLSLFYFEKKKVWLAIGIILVLAGGYFLLFSSAEDTPAGNGVVPDTPSNGAIIEEPSTENGDDEITFAFLQGTVVLEYECVPDKKCLFIENEMEGEIIILVEIYEYVEEGFEIETYGYFGSQKNEFGTSFFMPEYIIIREGA